MQNQITASMFKNLGIALSAFVFVAVAAAPVLVHAADLPSYSYSGGNGYQYSGGNASTPTYSGGSTNTSYSGGSGYQYSGGNASTPTYSGGGTTSHNTTYSGGNGYQYSGGDGYTTYTTSTGCTSNCGGTTVTTPKPRPTCTITATPSSITQGHAVVVTWSSTHAVSGNITNIGSNVAMSGSYTLYPSQNTTYTATFKSAQNKTVTCSTSVTVVQQTCPAGYTGTYPNCVQIQYCPAGYTGTYPNCVPPPQYCPAGYTGTYPNCYPPVQNNPSCTITINNYNNTNNNYYNPNQAVTISWNSSFAQNGFINQGLGSVALSGTRTVYPTQTTTYTGTFYGTNGQSVTCSATVYVNNVPPPVYPNTPYVTLAAVPYTGLDLGPVGTVVYWGFLAFWCLLAAYLIAVKRVQNQVYASLKGILFGTSTETQSHAPAQTHAAHTAPAPRNEDLVDDFVMAQINRARA